MMDVIKTFKKEAENLFIPMDWREGFNQLRPIQIEMLTDFIHFCDEHGFLYYLTCGSALGAIRHQGFIPWDDDIDIVMPRSDYNRLRNIFESSYPDKYAMEAPMTKHTGSVQFMKIRKKGTVLRGLMARGPEYGVFIDIFPLEYAPKTKLVRFFYQCWYFVLKSLPYSVIFYELYDSVFRPHEKECSKKLVRHMHIKRNWGRFLSIFTAESFLNYFDKSAQRKKSDYYGVPSDTAPYMQECFPVDWYYPPRKAIFEGLEVNIPNKVEKVMQQYYGPDYMSPPKDIPRFIEGYIDVDLSN